MKITLLTGKIFDIENAFDFPLKVKTSFKSKRISIRIDHKKRIAVLSMPIWYSKSKACAFIEVHRDWIEEKLFELPEAKNFEDGEQISVCGRLLTICHKPSFGAPHITENRLCVGGEPVFLHRRVKDFIKREAKKQFLIQSQNLAQKIGCQLTGVSIKDTTSRWGSCSSLKHINYNWRIALAPPYVIDYIIAHEVAHLKHQDHSPSFWDLVKSLCPAAEAGKAWLKSHGNELYAYR